MLPRWQILALAALLVGSMGLAEAVWPQVSVAQNEVRLRPAIRQSLEQADVAPEKVIVRVHNHGVVDVGSQRYTDDATLKKALTALARQNPQPDMYVTFDRVIRFEALSKVILLMQECGLHQKIGIITPPRQ